MLVAPDEIRGRKNMQLTRTPQGFNKKQWKQLK